MLTGSFRRILRLYCYCVAAWLVAGLTGPSRAETAVTYPRHESGMTTHTDYYFELLQTALERTREEFGSYTLRYTEQGMNPARAVAELAAGSGKIDIDVRGWSAERGKLLHQIMVPLDRGLIGYRLLLIRKEDQAKFDTVRKLEDLKQFRFGLLKSWGDVNIFEHNQLAVVTGNNFEGLFKMLDLGRFDAFSRDMNEIQDELDQRSAELPQLAIERSLLLRYPSARYFFLSKTPSGLKLAARIDAGLRQMKSDGSFDTLFRKHKSEQIAKFQFSNRRIIYLTNPMLPADAPELPQDLLPAAAGRRKS